MEYGCTVQQFMTLIKRSKIPPKYKERQEFCHTSRRLKSHEESFYLESGSVTINIYDKEAETRKKHPDNLARIEAAKGVLRFEVQYNQYKLYPIKRGIINKADWWNETDTFVVKQLLSDVAAQKVIYDYFGRTIMHGDYYTLSKAVKMIKDRSYRSDKEERLIKILKLINTCRGVTKAAMSFITDQNSANEFNRT